MPTPLHHAFLAELPGQARVLLRLGGDDAPRFLQGLLTADVGQLTPGRALPAALLTVKGKIVSEVIVLSPPGQGLGLIWLAIPAELADSVQAQLDGHVIMDDVQIDRLDARAHALVLVWAGVDADIPGGSPAIASFTTEHPLHGILLVGPAAELQAWLAEHASEAVDEPTFTSLRIDQARPAWGHELVPDRFPPEVGFVDAVSYTKGCYMGQEPLSRIHNRGQVNRVMVRVEAERSPGAGTSDRTVFLGPGFEDPIGEWTSWAGTRGLAIIKRKHAEIGKRLRTGEGLDLAVCSGPLGDDPGGPGRTLTKVQLGGRR